MRMGYEMRFMKQPVLGERHKALRDWITRHLESAQKELEIVRASVEAALEHAKRDPLRQLEEEEYRRRYGWFAPPELRALETAEDTVREWEDVLRACDENPEIVPDDAIWSDWPQHRAGIHTLEEACWCALLEIGQATTRQLVGLDEEE